MLWLEQLLGLIFQVVGTIYTFALFIIFKKNKLWLPTILMFAVGLIKCSERVKALLITSFISSGEILLPKPDGSTGNSAELDEIPRLPSRYEPGREFKLLSVAISFIEHFMVLLSGSGLSFEKGEKSRNYFLECKSSDAFRLVEYELSIFHDLMHTKTAVLHSWLGYMGRSIIFVSFLAANILYFLSPTQSYARFDVALTNAMLVATLVLEAIYFLSFTYNDSIIPRLEQRVKKYVPQFILKRQRWSRTVFQHNVFACCLYKNKKGLLYRLAKCIFDSTVFEDKMIATWLYSSNTVTEKLEEFIFNELKKIPINTDDLKAAKEVCSQRGLSALPQDIEEGLPQDSEEALLQGIEGLHYLKSLLLWHLATEICHHNLHQNFLSAESENQREICKVLSDYMFYLLVMQPTMLSPEKGNWLMVFEDTQAEAMKFFEDHKISDHKKACQELNSAAVMGSTCNSLLKDACVLAEKLRHREDKWKVLSRVWVGLMCFGAMSCSPTIHAQQPGRGGELLTLIWLLMHHLGLGT